MLLYFDLTPSLNTLSRFRLVTKVRPVLNDPFLFQLVSSFPLLDSNQRDWSIDSGIPVVGLLTNVLFYLYLDDFDREIINLFPSINYARFLHAAIFAITQQSQSAASVLASVDKIENILRLVVDQENKFI